MQLSVGDNSLALLHSPQPLPVEAVLMTLINDVGAIPEDVTIILDDYHLINSVPIHTGITFLLEHLPPRMHLVIWPFLLCFNHSSTK